MSDYVVQNRDQTELHTVACRLLLDMLPGLDVSVIFKDSVRIFKTFSIDCSRLSYSVFNKDMGFYGFSVAFRKHLLENCWDSLNQTFSLLVPMQRGS